MKKIFLLFGALFLIAGCADDSGSNGSNNIPKCALTSADFKFEKYKPDPGYDYKYDTIGPDKIMDYLNYSYKWVTSYGVEYNEPMPHYQFTQEIYDTNPTTTLYFNGDKCGEPLEITNPKNEYILK